MRAMVHEAPEDQKARACWYCGGIVVPRKGLVFIEGDERCIVHKTPCHDIMLTMPNVARYEFEKEA